MVEIRPLLLADDQQHAGLEQDAHRLGRDAGEVEHDFDGLLRLEDVDHGHAFAGDHVPAVRPAAGQIIEQAMDVLGQVSRLVH